MTTIGGSSRLERAELGDGDLEVGQHFQQIGLERLVGAVELVDQEHRRVAVIGCERLQQRPLEQELRRRRCLRPALLVLRRPPLPPGGSRSSAASSSTRRPPARCRGLRSTAGGSARGRAPAPGPWRSRSCRRPPRLRGTAAGRSQREEQRRREAAIGHVIVFGQKLESLVDVARGIHRRNAFMAPRYRAAARIAARRRCPDRPGCRSGARGRS